MSCLQIVYAFLGASPDVGLLGRAFRMHGTVHADDKAASSDGSPITRLLDHALCCHHA